MLCLADFFLFSFLHSNSTDNNDPLLSSSSTCQGQETSTDINNADTRGPKTVTFLPRDPSGYEICVEEQNNKVLSTLKKCDVSRLLVEDEMNKVESSPMIGGLPSASPSSKKTETEHRESMEISNHSNNVVHIHDPMNQQSLRDILAKQGFELRRKKSTLLERLQNLSQLKVFCIGALAIPTIISLWYASAILFPPGARKKAGFILWTDGHLKYEQGRPIICPRDSICSEGVLQIILIALARLSAFASYVAMGMTFLSKMHSLIHFLSNTYLSMIIPFESLHDVHTLTGRMFGWLAFLHTLTHYVRYAIRRDADQIGSQVHISGLFAMMAMAVVTLSMSSYAKKYLAFEKRFNAHWVFLIVVLALLFHTNRTRNIVFIFL